MKGTTTVWTLLPHLALSLMDRVPSHWRNKVREEETDEHPGRILIVDDNLASLRLLTDLLAEQGYAVHPASRGEVALRFIQSTLPDLILLDIKMPGLDGYQVCERLKADERARDIPVIFLTALADTADKVKGFQAGGVDYITKPLQVEEILARVKTHVALHALQKQRAAQSARLEEEISERKRVELALRENQARYRNFIANSSEGICRIELEQPISIGLSEEEQIEGFFQHGYLGECNDAYARMYGRLRADDLVKMRLKRLLPRHDPCIIALIRAFIRSGYRLVDSEPYETVSQKNPRIFVSSFVGTVENGFLVRAWGIQRDVTERRRAEDAIREQVNFQQTMIDTIPSPIFYKDREGRYLGCNSSFESFIGLSKADIIGKSVYDIAPKDLADRYHEADAAVFKNPGVQRYETLVRYADGSNHDVFFTKGTFTDLEGKVAGLVGVMLDITQRKRTEEELVRYRDHLEELVKERTSELAMANEQLTREIEERRRAEAALKDTSEKLKFFAYSVAHDLKSPAIGIYGLTRRLSRHSRDLLDEKGRTYCHQILKASEHIAALVDKVNVYIATKEARLSIERINIGEVLQMLKEEFSAQLSLRQIDWRIPETGVEISADRLSLLRAFRNLIDNSLKYGGERLSRIWTGYEESEDFHIFSVSDDGRGLKAEDTERIFGAFQRDETSRGIEGAGLGLSIVKEIAAQHGGKVWVEPRTKKGTTFFISIAKNL